MPKNKKTINEIEETAETEEMDEIDPEEEIKGMLFDNLLSEFSGNKFDYTAHLYKMIKGKRTFVAQYDNEIPHPVHELQEKYQGGDFRIYIKRCSDGKLIKTVDTHVMEPLALTNQNTTPETMYKKEVFNDLKSMAEIMSGRSENTNDNQIQIKLMEMMMTIADKFSKMQIDSENRTRELIMQMMNKKTDVGEFVEIFKVLNELKQDAEPSGLVEKIISSPVVQPLIGQLASGLVPSFAEKPPALPQPEPAGVTAKPTIEEYIQVLPEKFIETVNEKNADKMTEHLFDKNKETLDMETASNIILHILKNKPKKLEKVEKIKKPAA